MHVDPGSGLRSTPQSPIRDIWSEWLLARRHGGDPALAATLIAGLEGIRDRVLDGAALQPGMRLVDIGCGDGLIAFGAFDRVGPSLECSMVDISAPLLHRCEERARAAGVWQQCTFLNQSAEHLEGIANDSADAVTARAALAYVADKPRALSEAHRVLKAGGRLSIAEPVIRDQALDTVALTNVVEASAAGPNLDFLRLLQRWKATQFPSTEAAMAMNPLTNYTERDLVRFAQAAGFTTIHLELHVDVLPSALRDWSIFLSIAPHPLAPTLAETLDDRFTAEERRRFEAVIRPMVEAGQWTTVGAVAYLTAQKTLP